MKVAVYYNNNDIRIEEIKKPEIKDGELLVKVNSSGICGTDAMEWYRTKKSPRVLGHEITGDISESKTKKYKKGQRVFVSHHVPCNNCKYCLAGNHTACDMLHAGNYEPGGYSEFVRLPAVNVDKGTYILPESVSYEEGTMIEPLACSVRAQEVIDVKKGEHVLILGSGVSGLLNIALAKLRGAQVTAADINEYRLKKAGEFGADNVIDASSSGLDSLKADKIIISTGAVRAAEQAFKCVDKKGVILFFAIPDKNIEIPMTDFWRNELTVTSSYGAAPYDLQKAIELIKNRKIDVKSMITHSLPLDRIQEGFKLVTQAGESLKVVLKP